MKGNPNPAPTYQQYMLREINNNKEKGTIQYGITIPKRIAIQFIGIKFTAKISGNNIILASGLDLKKMKEEIDDYSIEDL